jgi:hypothetical protein
MILNGIHWGALFDIFVAITIFIVLWQIKLAQSIDIRRFNGEAETPLFKLRRAAMFLKVGALCWTVIYSAQNDWQPWPPIVVFIAAFDVYVITAILVMRKDLERLKRLDTLSGRAVVD